MSGPEQFKNNSVRVNYQPKTHKGGKRKPTDAEKYLSDLSPTVSNDYQKENEIRYQLDFSSKEILTSMELGLGGNETKALKESKVEASVGGSVPPHLIA